MRGTTFITFLALSCIFQPYSKKEISQAVKVYPYYIEPQEYADYSRRPFKTPTWKTFNNEVQFVGGRSWGDTYGIIDVKPPAWMEGAKVMRPNFIHFLMNEDSLRDALLRFKNGGYYLFNINAYGPGTPLNGIFGQFRVEKWKAQMMKNFLQDRYMGFDLGEQDGRYWADARSIDYPMSSDYQERYIKAMKYMQRAAMDQGDIISLLSVKWFWHYPVKDGFITISGAETQNKSYTSNGQVQYAFIRGAAKQYGLLWYGDISIFNSWGWKFYGIEKKENAGPNKGNSISWMKRMLLTQYQFNSAILGFEDSKFYVDQKNEIKLTPIGVLQTDMQEFIKKYPRPGPQFTPVALLLDFFSGWMTPSDPYPERYKVWNYLPYQKGDFLTHELLKMFFENYDQNGLNKNENGALSNTPYGDALDVLLSDTPITTLSRYQVVVVAGELLTNLQEVADKLLDYTKMGGHLVITIENARKLFPDLILKETNNLFEVEEITIDKGRISIIHCTDMGINFDNTLNIYVKNYLDSIFKSTRIFSVGDSLGYITNIEGNGMYMLGVYNNSLRSKEFDIKCLVGKIKNIEELHPIRNLSYEPGYFPEGYENTKPGLSDEKNIAAGDVRLFIINVDEEDVKYLPEIIPEKRVLNRYLSMSSLISMQEVLQSMPTFFDYFSGVKITWKNVCEIDSIKFREDCWWYNLKQLQIAVEFNNDFLAEYKTNSQILTQIIHKLSASENVSLLVFPGDFSREIIKKISSNIKSGHQIILEGSDKLIIARNGEIDFSESKSKYLIIDNFYNSWDEIYPIAKAINTGSSIILQKNNSTYNRTEEVNLESKPGNSNLYFSHHDTEKDISTLLYEHPKYLDHFGGIKVDGTYLLSRSIEKCKKEAEWLNKTGLKIIVDLTREINNYPDLTWLSEIEHSYERSVIIHKNILNKMEIMGIKNVIICSHMRPEQWSQNFKRSQNESIISGISEFVKKAKDFGIVVSIQNMMYKHYPSRLLASPDEVVNLVNLLGSKYNNVKFAAHLGFGEDPLMLTTYKDKLNICIVAAEGSGLYDYRIPFSKSNNNEKIEIDRNVMVVFDADYSKASDLVEDKNLFLNKYTVQD